MLGWLTSDRGGSAAAAIVALALALGAPATATAQTPTAPLPEINALGDGDGAGAGADGGLPTGGVASTPLDVCGPVVLAEFDWPAARLAAAALRRLLEDGHGCSVRRRAASPDRALLAAGEADPSGPIIIAPGVSAAEVNRRRIGPGATVSIGLFPGAQVGFATPDWFRRANPSVATLRDAARRPELFRAPGQATSTLWLCPESWPCHRESRAAAEAAGFVDAGFELRTPASGEALVQSLIEAHAARRPWIGYLWTPSAAAAEHPTAFLNAGAVEICPSAPSQSGPLGCRAPFPNPTTVTVFSAALSARAPEAAAMTARFSAPADAVVDALAWRARTNASIEQTADFLLARRPELWRDLLDGPRRRRFETALTDRLSGAPD